MIVGGDEGGGGVSFSDGDGRRILEDRRSNTILNNVGIPLFALSILPLFGNLNLIPRGMMVVSKRLTWIKAFNSGILMVKRCAIVVAHSCIFSYGLGKNDTNDCTALSFILCKSFTLSLTLSTFSFFFVIIVSVTSRRSSLWWMWDNDFDLWNVSHGEVRYTLMLE